ncbi:hypothetical protein ACI2UK_24445 [Ralstonia nicotianae]|uniref:hypothetical protein n=1 Tax=Ralstonia pseudosolanacearum TaxID=1310165 RepID=UPI00200436F3|nr:hypothetical protein [Ralstonia pseudosolanacearum]
MAAEVAALINADSIASAAKVIDWWHNHWRLLGDTPRVSASKIRAAARALKVM